jgi:membrane protein YqaA with SNARE-associated domain
MKQIVLRIEAIAMALGGPGLFLIAVLDSSVLSLPEVNDILIVLMVSRHEELMLYYATMSTLGSIAGCFILYGIGRKGGEAFLRRRFHGPSVDRAMTAYQRYGFLAVLVPSILPPPTPFKIFVLLAGISRLSPLRFGLAVAIGRGIRYFGEGLLALWYGDRAIAYIRANGARVSLAVGATVLIVGVVYVFWRRRSRRPGRQEPTY